MRIFNKEYDLPQGAKHFQLKSMNWEKVYICKCFVPTPHQKTNMKYNPDKHHRRSIRLKDYDYSQNGAYFVTICTYKKQCLFGDIVNGKMELSEIGVVVDKCWKGIPIHFQNVSLDYFVIMPNHIRGIINIVGAKHSHLSSMNGLSILSANALPLRLHGTDKGSLGAIIQNFKSITTRKINKMLIQQGKPSWQKNYYEHVVRNDNDLNEICEYIINNPLKWNLDKENPINIESGEESNKDEQRF